ncbi:MAG: SCP2 sterol-binding domain-containing protein [Anaerolineaceae bacterium]|nr:SCP2 sterol-binding domain-containing protein [Anaerolineaceae bacterium]MDD4042224.1 SCP2 sterol-binding domain-containing protein [Anaerolineaceae bacterium]MDD4577982.1 SCP2 sterol-binding domain-containing protein [Anaerolineaceae bacterium]
MEKFSDMINNMPNQIDLEKAKGIQATIQFSISGEGGGEWGVTVDDGKVVVEPGQMAKPQLIVKASANDALKLMHGELNPVGAFMSGKVKIIGDMGLAMKLFNLLK